MSYLEIAKRALRDSHNSRAEGVRIEFDGRGTGLLIARSIGSSRTGNEQRWQIDLPADMELSSDGDDERE
jgi:hypothetical protein